MYGEEKMMDGVSIQPFNGNAGDDAKLWLNSLTDFIDFKTIAVDKRLSLFKLRLAGPAQAWMTALPPDQKDTYDHLAAAFLLRFSPKELEKFRYAKELFNEKQKPTQTVDEIITQIRRKSMIAGVDEATLAYIIINALSPNISSYVLEKDHETIEQIIQHARVAELTRGTAPTSTESGVSEKLLTLTEQVTRLNEKIVNLSIAAVNESPIKRQVSFENDRSRPQSPRERDRSGERDKYAYQRPNFGENNEKYNFRPQGNATNDGATYGRPDCRNYQRPDHQVRNDRPGYQPYSTWPGQNRQGQTDYKPRQEAYQQQQQSGDGRSDQRELQTYDCWRCHKNNHSAQECGMQYKSCFLCLNQGHAARVCKEQRQF